MNRLIVLISFLAFGINAQAQNSFVEQCMGQWEGMMYIHAQGVIRDSVEVEFLVAPTAVDTAWVWKTSYRSEKYPVVKDYVLRQKNAEKGAYIIDEGDELELSAFVFGNKMYSMFEVSDAYLTANYELLGDKLVFEVTSGSKKDKNKHDVTDFFINIVQRVELTKIEEDE